MAINERRRRNAAAGNSYQAVTFADSWAAHIRGFVRWLIRASYVANVPSYKDLPLLSLKSQGAFESWLAKQHGKASGAWVKFAKKASKQSSISYVEAREAAITYGWIDGLINAFDDDYSVRRFTPRRKRSKWSQINREIAQQLVDSGRMAASGLLQVEAAQADGRWAAAYPSQSQIEVPADFSAALGDEPRAGAAFKAASSANRYSILYALHNSKSPDTRARLIKKYVALLARGELPHPQSAKPG